MLIKEKRNNLNRDHRYSSFSLFSLLSPLTFYFHFFEYNNISTSKSCAAQNNGKRRRGEERIGGNHALALLHPRHAPANHESVWRKQGWRHQHESPAKADGQGEAGRGDQDGGDHGRAQGGRGGEDKRQGTRDEGRDEMKAREAWEGGKNG